MGCGGSKPQAAPSFNQKLTVYGDHFNSDTRTLLGILKVSKVSHVFERVNTFEREQTQPAYLQLNPSGQIPTLTEGAFNVIGGGNTMINFLVNKHKHVSETLYPKAQEEEIEKMLSWHQYRMRLETQRLIRMIVPSKVLGDVPASSEAKQKQRNNIYGEHGILSVLNDKLKQSNAYICGELMSVVDILIYSEISTILALTLKSEEEIAANHPEIDKWIKRMKQVDGIKDLDHELEEIIKRYGLAEKL